MGEFFAALDDVLENAGADDVPEGGLGTLNQGLTDVGDAEGGFVGGGDVVVDDGGYLEGDVVLGDTDLFGDLYRYNLSICICNRKEGSWRHRTNNLNLDVYLDQLFRERIDLDKTGVDRAVETTKLCDETDVSLTDWLIWVWTDDTAGNGTAGTDDRSEVIDFVTLANRKLEMT